MNFIVFIYCLDHPYTQKGSVHRYTSSILKEACEAYASGSLAASQCLKDSSKALSDMAGAVNRMAAALEQTNQNIKIKNKLKYYELFGTFDKFDDL